jgi:hypothetical protein
VNVPLLVNIFIVAPLMSLIRLDTETQDVFPEPSVFRISFAAPSSFGRVSV